MIKEPFFSEGRLYLGIPALAISSALLIVTLKDGTAQLFLQKALEIFLSIFPG